MADQDVNSRDQEWWNTEREIQRLRLDTARRDNERSKLEYERMVDRSKYSRTTPRTPERIREIVQTNSDPYGGRKPGDLCPKCGVASFVREEGCQKCHSCGYSEC